MSDQMGSCVPSTIRVEHMQVIRNQIEVKISDEQLKAANFTDGLTIQVRSEKPFTVNAYWIVKIRDIFSEIEKDWTIMLDELLSNKFLDSNEKSLYQNKPQKYDQSEEPVQCEIKPPKTIDTSTMTATPRDFYPLVIIVSCFDELADPTSRNPAANINVIHIKDEIVTIDTHVIKKYLKQPDGRILDISQSIYLEDTAACFICFEEANLEEGLRLLCLLPCRHSPICSNCITRIRECPKCRCPIASVFDINAPAAGAAQPPVTSTIDPNLRHLYDGEDDANRSRARGGILSSIKSMFGF